MAGCLAHGGLGWIYLAQDRNVSDRWVVLKGLLNTGDKDALAVAIVERQFLAQVEHPLIVEIYNFVTHDEAGYIVMEYVGGTSLKQILKERMRANSGRFDPLPVDQALAYILEILPAFSYLHDLGLVYCDFKPDNLIQVGDAVKLIDLGGVRRIDDHGVAIYGTVGYQAPEVAQVGTTVASDIYTIGRTLVVLITEFRGYQTRYVASLPSVADTPVFAEQDSLYRLIAKACAPDPADRFASVDELRVQLLGVLREVVAERTAGTALTSAASVLFEAPAVTGEALEWDELPALRIDTTDPQYAWLSNISLEDPEERLAQLRRAPEMSAEVLLAQAKAALQLRRGDLVNQIVNQMLAEDPWEWRAVWVSGLSALDSGDFAAAQSSFNAVYGQIPGELARQTGAGSGLRARRRGGDRGGAVPDLRQHRRQLRGPGRLRHGPDPHRAPRHLRSGQGTGSRSLDQPQLHRGPAAAGHRAAQVRAGTARALPGHGQPQRGVAGPAGPGGTDRIHPGTGRGRGEQDRPQDRGDDRPVRRARRDAPRRAGTHLPHARRHRDRRGPALRPGRQGERRAKVDPAMTEPTASWPRAGLPALRCRGQCRPGLL